MTTNIQKPVRISAIAIFFLLSLFSYTNVMAEYVESIDRGKIAGKQKNSKLYFSKVNGVKGYYSCPKGYKRFSPTRKMNHSKACTLRQPGKNKYKKAKYQGRYKYKCPKLTKLFPKGRQCMSCPKGSKLVRNETGDGSGAFKCKKK